jgi:hypothetical protein
LIATALVLALCLFVGGFALTRAFPGFRHALWHQISLSVVRQPATYDALYFTRPLALPSRVAAGIPSEFSFTITRQGASATVGYTVSLTDGQGTSLLATRRVRVDPGVPSVITQSFRVPAAGAFEVGVELSSQKVAIAFHGRAS